MQAAILAGGRATRMEPLTTRVPKSMLPVLGKPFFQYQLELLRRNGVRELVLCVGHLADQIENYFGDGSAFGVRIRYKDEGEKRLGTAGALKFAEDVLDDVFMVLFGDSYLMYDYRKIMDHFLLRKHLGMMVIYRNDNEFDSSDIVVDGEYVQIYDKDQPSPGMVHINSGLSVLRREVLENLSPGQPASLQEFYQALIAQREMLALEVDQRFYGIGSRSGLDEFERLAASGTIAS